MATKDKPQIRIDKSKAIKSVVKYKPIPDTYSQEKVSNSNEPYLRKEHILIDETIHDVVYRYLNKKIEPKYNEYLHYIIIKPQEFFSSKIIIDFKDLKNIIDEINRSLPSYKSFIEQDVFELTVLHYLARFLYDFSYHMLEKANNATYAKRITKTFILNHMYKIFFRYFTNARNLIYQQLSHVFVFSRHSFSQILNLFYMYTTYDEDRFMVECINTYAGGMLYKYNPIKARNIKSVLKSMYRKILSFLFSKQLTVKDNEDEIDTTYRIITNWTELENVNLQSRFTFLISILNKTISLTNNVIINNSPASYKHLQEIAKNTYLQYNSTIPNTLRILYYLLTIPADINLEIFRNTYNDLEELLKLYTPNKDNYLKKYPELVRFIKAVTLRREQTKGTNIFRFSHNKFKEELKSKLYLSFGFIDNDEYINELAKELTSHTYKYFKNVVFIHPISNIPIQPIDVNKFYQELAAFYIDFITNNYDPNSIEENNV